eukprot:bmy_08827T0
MEVRSSCGRRESGLGHFLRWQGESQSNRDIVNLESIPCEATLVHCYFEVVMCRKNHRITDQKYKGNSYSYHHPSAFSFRLFFLENIGSLFVCVELANFPLVSIKVLLDVKELTTEVVNDCRRINPEPFNELASEKQDLGDSLQPCVHNEVEILHCLQQSHSPALGIQMTLESGQRGVNSQFFDYELSILGDARPVLGHFGTIGQDSHYFLMEVGSFHNILSCYCWGIGSANHHSQMGCLALEFGCTIQRGIVNLGFKPDCKVSKLCTSQHLKKKEAPIVPMMAAPEPQEPGKGKVELEDHVTLEYNYAKLRIQERLAIEGIKNKILYESTHLDPERKQTNGGGNNN